MVTGKIPGLGLVDPEPCCLFCHSALFFCGNISAVLYAAIAELETVRGSVYRGQYQWIPVEPKG